MDKIVEKALLFDFYGELLTENQKEVYGEYIQDDLSASEIAQIRGISRQGVHDMIRRCDKILADYEQRLHLVEHFLTIKKMVATIHQYAEELSVCEDEDILQSRIADIKSLSSEILDQF
ncbi:MAG: DNA-binding protein [Clostridiales bacterium]|nr:DNA-binding protein [Clostridiales bacterium]